jgi:hypothetical protein
MKSATVFLLMIAPLVVWAADGPWPADVPGHVPIEAREHPRLLFRKADLPELRKRAATPAGKEILDRLRKQLNGGDGESMPQAYNPVVGEAAGDGTGDFGKNAPDGAYTFSHAAGFGLLYQLTGDKKYADLGRQCMEKALEGVRDRDNRYAFKHPYGALRAGPSLGWTALGYDLCYDGWDEAFQRKMTDALFNYAGSSKKSEFDLEYLVKGKRHFPASNHWSMQVGGGAMALLAVMGDPGTDEKKVAALLKESERAMIRNVTEGFGDGGYFAEGDGTGSMASHIIYLSALQAWKNAAGKDFISPRPNVQWTYLKWFLQTVPKGGDLAGGFAGRGGYPHNIWARDGISGAGYCSIGYGVATEEQIPGIWWFYKEHLHEADEKHGAPWDTVSPYPHHSVIAFVNTPFGVEPKNPADCMPRQVYDSIRGFYAFRNRSKDGNDIVITQLVRRSPARFRHGPDKAMTIQHHGKRELWGSLPPKAEVRKPGKDGSTILGDGKMSVAIDFSGASGADGMIVFVGSGAPSGRIVEAGGQKFVFKFLTGGAEPEPKVSGASVIAGKQTVSYSDGAIVLGVFHD